MAVIQTSLREHFAQAIQTPAVHTRGAEPAADKLALSETGQLRPTNEPDAFSVVIAHAVTATPKTTKIGSSKLREIVAETKPRSHRNLPQRPPIVSAAAVARGQRRKGSN